MSSHSLVDINADFHSSDNTGMMKKTNHTEHTYITYTTNTTDSNNYNNMLRIGYVRLLYVYISHSCQLLEVTFRDTYVPYLCAVAKMAQ